MKNRNVGIMILVIALFILFLIVSYNKALQDITSATCSMGPTCSMNTAINAQKTISYGLVGLLVLGSLYIIFFMKEKLDPSEVTKPSKKVLSKLDETEKKIIELISNNQGSMYQSDIMKEMDLSKVKITRLLDKLESSGLVERKRRGMTNIVVMR
ncbi:MAG: MarR family transcriptional regulator [Candidatus Woesearchaeota archaeon]|nr:MarR family transcriptional regulator [Candidatus Woesearchaeota archaeon]